MGNSVSILANQYISAVLALTPIVWIFLSMLKLKLPSHKASIIALAGGGTMAFIAWKMPAVHLFEAIIEGIALGIWPILWVIFAAVFTFNLLVRSGAMDTIKKMLSGISPDIRVQVLIIAFGFGGILEATAGFGTAVVIPASILITLGFEPVFSAVVCLIANTVPVAFGVVGIPVITLAKVTDLPLDVLTLYTALQLAPFVLVLPFVLVAVTTGSIKGLRGVVPVSLISGVSFCIGQTVTAWLVGPELSAIVGSLMAFVSAILWVRVFPIKKPWLMSKEGGSAWGQEMKIGFIKGIKVWSPYILILFIVLCTRLVPFLDFLNRYPFELAYTFYSGPGGKPLTFSLLTNPGTIIMVSAVIGGLIQGVSFKAMFAVSGATLKQIGKTAVTVLSIVSLAKVMGYSSMISSIAVGLASLTGSFFPLFSPLIGALGTFITGSDTSSNVLFGELQKQTAMQIGFSASWIAAGNASGATAGKMVSPQSIAIATSAAGLKGREAKILTVTMRYALVFVVLLGIVVYFFNTLIQK